MSEQNSSSVARGPQGILVNSREMALKVFLDAEENYSVSGYAERARKCFGEFYLTIDKGPEYYRQSAKVNEAIQAITAAEAFGLALGETRKALAGSPAALADPAAHVPEISVKVLAALCTLWFDIPDHVNVVEGGLRSNMQPPLLCPGDFALPSGYIFKPEPEDPLPQAGPAVGVMLRRGVSQFVAARRASGKLPDGVLSRAIFEAFPNGEDDLIARTIIGIMMGMLPTIDGNLNRSIPALRRNGAFPELQDALKRNDGKDPYSRASEALATPLMHAVQFDPVPDAVWRTAVREHTLGTDAPVPVKPGDKVYVQIANATREDVLGGITDIRPVFGGNRRDAAHAVHACPGYEMAMGIMLGVLNGVLEPA